MKSLEKVTWTCDLCGSRFTVDQGETLPDWVEIKSPTAGKNLDVCGECVGQINTRIIVNRMGEPDDLDGADRIAQERERQIHREGWSAEHDEIHDLGELVAAAICYAEVSRSLTLNRPEVDQHILKMWPWDVKWYKPDKDPIRNLEKAGALIAAEIDRLLSFRKDKE